MTLLLRYRYTSIRLKAAQHLVFGLFFFAPSKGVRLTARSTSDVVSIQRMRLGQALPPAVPICAPAGPSLNWETVLFQCREQRRSRGIDGGRSLQRHRRKLQEAHQPGLGVRQEHLDILRGFILFHGPHASVRLLMRFEPPVARACMCSAAGHRSRRDRYRRAETRSKANGWHPKVGPGAENRRHDSPLRAVLPTAVALRRRPPHATALSLARFHCQPTWSDDNCQ